MLAYKFVWWEVPTLESLANTTEYKLASKLEDGHEMTRAEKNQLAALAKEYGHIKLQGWLFPLSGLRTFYVEQYGNIYKRRAHDATAIRATSYGRVEKIVLRN